MLRKMMLAVIGMVAVPAMAATDVWSFNSGSFSGSGHGNSFNISGTGSNGLGVTGWSDTGTSADDKIESGSLTYNSSYGLMLQNRDEGASNVPGHSIDNYGNDFDMVLLTFDEAVSLEGFGIGWACEGAVSDTSGCKKSDGSSALKQADITVAAYTGAGSFSFSSSDTWSSVAGSNWSTVGHYGDVNDWSYQAVNTNINSKYWLIGAYNSAFSGTKFGSVGTGWKDGFKLASVQGTTYTPPGVPEPGTLALLAGGLFGLTSLRKRRTR